jgi:hypothetical protein
MKVVKAIAILVGIPALGIIIACLLGALSIRLNPKFDAVHATPGDGILIMLFILISLIVSIPIAGILAGSVLFRKPKPSQSN